ncbi:MAG: AzlD domain-containing protein [Rhizobiaceae bacterium]
MSYHALDDWWWPYLFILVAGWLATDVWRVLGVYLAGRLATDSEWLVLARTVATALAAGVVGNLVVFPGGALAATPLAVRIGAVAMGFGAYLVSGRRIIAGIAACEAMLMGYLLLIG